MFFKKLALATGIATLLAVTGCGEEKASDMSKIKVGVIAGAEEQIAEVAAKIAKEKYNLNVELITFSDYISPNAALAEGAIDVNAFQHKPYLDQQLKDRGYQFAIAGNSFLYPIAGYSKKITSLEELKEQDKIALPNDPSNLGRALLLLQKQGIIQLDEKAGIAATVLDITSNPKKLQFIELEAAQLPRALDDVALAIINNSFASAINLMPNRDGIFVEDKESPYVNLIVATATNINDQNVQQFVKAYQTDEVYSAASALFNDSVVKGW
ncbi:MAG: methionine ABC transporter substrate-binding lipoprotein MetQ [Vibrionaceae bacterium]